MIIIFSCSKEAKKMTVSSENVTPGSKVSVGKASLDLYPGSTTIGQNIAELIKTELGTEIKKEVTVINIVPSIDTPVCEEQTHILGESEQLNSKIQKISISRDLPFAQKRFAKEAKLENIDYISDFKTGSFGKVLGLLIKDKEIHARAVMVLDSEGILQHFQLVPDVTHLPNMKKAFEVANKLLEQNK
jgi:thiol peroxidase